METKKKHPVWLTICLCPAAGPLWAEYPDRPITMYVTYAVGSSMDMSTRLGKA
jgi:tripartite-type tricarboxylate transporter receptor subunit TctC